MAANKQTIYWELLILRCRHGERQAFEELIGQWEQRLFYYVRRLVATEEDAWDVLQQTWIKVLKGIPSLKNPQSLRTWLYRIARNTALAQWRAEYKQLARRDESNDLSETEVQQEDFPFTEAEQVHRGLGKITLPHREVLTLYFLEDLSMNQIAGVLDVPLGTVKSRLHHAKRALRAVLAQEQDDHE